jgi:hypothetical protein
MPLNGREYKGTYIGMIGQKGSGQVVLASIAVPQDKCVLFAYTRLTQQRVGDSFCVMQC